MAGPCQLFQGAVEEGWFCGTHSPFPDACTLRGRFYPSRGRSTIVWEWGISGTLSLDFPVLAEEESVWGSRPWRGLSGAPRAQRLLRP